jgi:hypothetical protein
VEGLSTFHPPLETNREPKQTFSLHEEEEEEEEEETFPLPHPSHGFCFHHRLCLTIFPLRLLTIFPLRLLDLLLVLLSLRCQPLGRILNSLLL